MGANQHSESLQGAWRLAQERAVRVIELEAENRRLIEQLETERRESHALRMALQAHHKVDTAAAWGKPCEVCDPLYALTLSNRASRPAWDEWCKDDDAPSPATSPAAGSQERDLGSGLISPPASDPASSRDGSS